jgi:formate hydrogenlyase subunit 3/multisubunit Na+/H+ antiporter MnhD subunit
MTTLAIPFYLAAVWLFELHELNPDDVGIAIRAVELVVLSFGIFLAVVPFHAWVPSLSSDAPPFVFSLVLSNISAAILFLLLDIFQLHPWLIEDGRIFKMMRVGGLLTAALSGALAFAQRDFGRLLGYASLGDMGFILVALGTASSSGLSAAFLQFAGRSLALLLAGMSLDLMRRSVGGDSFSDLRGIGRSLPVATFGLILGGLSLSGFPLTFGFVTRWALLRLVGDFKWVLLGSSCGVSLGFLQGLVALLSPTPSTKFEREPLVASFIILVAIAFCLLLGLYPQFLLPLVQDFSRGIPFSH